MRLTEKTIGTSSDGTARVRRRCDQAQTSFDRLCRTSAILAEHQEQLEEPRDQTDPRRLRNEIYHLIEELFRVPSAVPGQSEDVHLTLTTSPLSQKGGGIPVALSFDRTVLLG